MQETDSLSNPVRVAIVRRLEADASATLEQLAEAAGVHRNTARAHAEVLEQAGLIERGEGARGGGAGRPRTQYRLTEAARRSEPPALAKLLGEALSESALSQRQANRVGRLRAAAIGRLVPKRRRGRELETQL